MDLDPRRLLTLQAVHRHGSVSAAAAVLRITPSAVSQQLAALERSSGVALIDRSERAVQLTAAGLKLMDAARQIERALDDATNELGSRQDSITGTVVVGAFQSAIISLVSPAVVAVRDRFPGLSVQVREVADAAIPRMVRSGEIDVGTVEARLNLSGLRGLGAVAVLDDPWQLVAPTMWGVRTVSELTTRAWVSTFDDARADALSQVAAIVGFRPRIEHRCVEYPSVLALVAAGAGAAVVPRMALTLFGSSLVRSIALPGLGSRTVTVLHRSSRSEPSAAVSVVIDMIGDSAAAIRRST